MAQPASHRSSGGPPSAAVPDELSPHLSALLHATGWGLAFLDRELRPRWVNGALTTLSGLSSTSYGPTSLVELWPGLAPGLAPLVARAQGGEAVQEAPVSGSFRAVSAAAPLHLRVSVLPAVSGGVLAGYTLVVRDETAPVREAHALREREALLAGIAEVSCDGYFFHEGGRVLEANSTLAHLLGTTPERMAGQSIFNWVAPESRTDAQAFMRREVESPFEVLGLREDGVRLHLEVLGRPVNYQGRPMRLVAVWDVSARKAADEVASRTAHFRDHLMAVLGHDLRTPVYTIQLGAAALQRAELSEPEVKQVGQMVGAAKRMERMIRELLDFTRARLAGGLTLQPGPVSLEAVMARVVEDQRLSWPTRAIHATIEGDLQGYWDEARLTQLVDNLVGNALQHSPKESPVQVRLAGARDGITLSIVNEGPALPAEEHAILFEPFRRGRRAQGEGLGLGLYIARQIALAHAGRISVESGFGHPTRFTVWLPREAPSSGP